MSRRLFLVIAFGFLLAFVPSMSAQWIEYEHPIDTVGGDRIIRAQYLFADTILVTENSNEIYLSYNGGITWINRNQGSPFFGNICRAVHYDPKEQRIWVGCERDQIWVSDDYGQTWTDVWPFNITTRFNSIYAFDKDRIFFADEFNGFGFYSVSDQNVSLVNDSLVYGGRSQGHSVGTVEMGLQTSFVNDSIGYLVLDDDFRNNETPFIYKTVDGGLTWRVVAGSHPDSYNDKRIYIVQFVTEDVGYGVSKWYRNLYKTVDGGKTWNLALDVKGQIHGYHFWTENNQNSFDFVDENFGMVVTKENVYRTQDGGVSWVTVSPEPTYHSRFIYGVDCFNRDNCLLFGHGNYSVGSSYKPIWITSNGGGPGIPLSAEEITPIDAKAKLWPVPSSGTTQLSLSGYTSETLIRVQDMAGRWVYTATTESPQLTLPSDQWPAGMYLVHIIAEDQPTEVLKLVRQ